MNDLALVLAAVRRDFTSGSQLGSILKQMLKEEHHAREAEREARIAAHFGFTAERTNGR